MAALQSTALGIPRAMHRGGKRIYLMSLATPVVSGAVFYALNSPKIICQEACSTPPEPIAELRGPSCGREGREGKEGKGER